MPGPMSAPNGDRRLTTPEVVCASHGEGGKHCTEDCTYVQRREYLLRRNRLVTGKTARTRRR